MRIAAFGTFCLHHIQFPPKRSEYSMNITHHILPAKKSKYSLNIIKFPPKKSEYSMNITQFTERITFVLLLCLRRRDPNDKPLIQFQPKISKKSFHCSNHFYPFPFLRSQWFSTFNFPMISTFNFHQKYHNFNFPCQPLKIHLPYWRAVVVTKNCPSGGRND